MHLLSYVSRKSLSLVLTGFLLSACSEQDLQNPAVLPEPAPQPDQSEPNHPQPSHPKHGQPHLPPKRPAPPTPMPKPPASDFGIQINPGQMSLQTGHRERNAAGIKVVPGQGFVDKVNLSVKASDPSLVITLNGYSMTIDASNAKAGRYTVTVTGVSGKLRRQAKMTVQVAPEPEGVVQKVTVSPAQSAIEAGKKVILQAKMYGKGDFSRKLIWQTTAGRVVAGANGQGILHIPAKTPAGKVIVTVRSQQAPGMLALAYVKVSSTTLPIVLKEEAGSISYDSTIRFGYIGSAKSVSLAKASKLVKSVELEGQELAIHSSAQSGSETLQLKFALQGGRSITVPFRLTVTKSKTAPPYQFLPGSQRNATIEERQLLAEVNKLRAKGITCGSRRYPAVAPLKWHNKLAKAARSHSLDMGKRNYVAHTTPELHFPNDRAKAAGYSWFGVGENLAAGADNAAQVVARWASSAGHCSEMMKAINKDAGVGIERIAGSNYHSYWTLKTGAGEKYKPPRWKW